MAEGINRNSIGERVGRLEVGLKTVTEDVHALRGEIRQGLKDLSQTVKEQRPQGAFYIGLASIIVVLFFGIGSAAYVPVWITTNNINAKAQAALDDQKELAPKLTAFREKLREVETQFRGNEQIRNIQFAEQQRMNNILMQMGQGVVPVIYPTGPYYSPKMTPEANDGEESN